MRRTANPHIPQQAGVALITAMLVTALAASLVAAMIARQQLDIRRSANMSEVDQIALYASGIAGWTGVILSRDRQQGERDHLHEQWAMVVPPIPVENGQLSGYLSDMQGRFNLNSLMAGDQPDPLAEARFRRLLAILGLNPDLVIPIIDWLDDNIEPGYPDGAEDDLYLGLAPPYRAANRAVVVPSELLLVQGIGMEQYRLLEPHISVLPVATAINVNTASRELLMSLAEGITQADAEALMAARGNEGYDGVEGFIAQEALAGREVSADGLAVASSYFLATSDIRIGRIQQRHYALLHRGEAGGSRILFHSSGL